MLSQMPFMELVWLCLRVTLAEMVVLGGIVGVVIVVMVIIIVIRG